MPLSPAIRRFMAGTSTAIAPVAALPTTAAHFSIWNGGSKTLTITAAGFTSVVSAGAAQILQLIGHCSSAGQPLIAGTVANGPKGTDGVFGGSVAQAYSAVTLTAGALAGGMWHPIGSAIDTSAQTASIGTGTWTNVRGLYVLPPGGIFSLAGFCNAAGSTTCQFFVNWEEQ